SQTQPAHSYNAAYVWVISSVGALGGLLFGYDWVVIGGAKPFYEKYFQLISESSIGWANSCALIGCLLGSVLSGSISDRFGRKKLRSEERREGKSEELGCGGSIKRKEKRQQRVVDIIHHYQTLMY